MHYPLIRHGVAPVSASFQDECCPNTRDASRFAETLTASLRRRRGVLGSAEKFVAPSCIFGSVSTRITTMATARRIGMLGLDYFLAVIRRSSRIIEDRVFMRTAGRFCPASTDLI